jgi:Domain of unknown function (DUF4279)
MEDETASSAGGPDYDDDYPTCAATYATLRIYTGKVPPEQVTVLLRLEPSKLQVEDAGAHLNGWFLSTKDRVQSRDLRRHVDWLLEQIVPLRSELATLQARPGVWMDVLLLAFDARAWWPPAHAETNAASGQLKP